MFARVGNSSRKFLGFFLYRTNTNEQLNTIHFLKNSSCQQQKASNQLPQDLELNALPLSYLQADTYQGRSSERNEIDPDAVDTAMHVIK